MKGITIFFLTVIILFLLPGGTRATDLPIDIDSIGLQSGYDDAFTARFNVDLFSAEAQSINETMALKAQLQREAALDRLFACEDKSNTIDLKQQMSSQTLFSQPINYSTVSKGIDPASLPIWLILILFIVCSGGGFWGARLYKALVERKK